MMKKRILGLLLCLCLVLALFPVTALADGATGEVSSETELKAALSAGVTSIKLVNDFSLSGKLNLSDKVITLDLNGHTLKGKILLADSNAGLQSILTLIDSDPDGRGVLDGEIELTRGNYGGASHLYANGGTITGKVSLNSYIAKIFCTSSTPTAIQGYVGNTGEIHGGILYGYFNTSCIKEKAVTFQNGSSRYAVEVVASGSQAVAPIEPENEGYTFAGWYNGDTKYDFTQPVTENITLTAKWVTSNPSNETELKDAIDAGLTTIKLASDFTLSSKLSLSDKIITLDLNGHTLKGDIILADSNAGLKSILTLMDSDPAGRGVLDGDIELTRGDYGGVSYLYANGGTITGKVSLNSYIAKIFCTSDTPTAIRDYVGNYGEIHGGILYGYFNENCIKEKTVTFQNGSSSYAVEVVADGSKVVAPADPTVPEGKKFTGWYKDAALTEPYEFGGELTESITLYAGIETITYTVQYDGGAEFGLFMDIKTYGVDLTLPSETFHREGYLQTGWQSSEGAFYELGGIYSANADVTLYPVWDEIITLTVPFSTTVALGDNGVPGETVFELVLTDGRGNELTEEHVEVSASVTTNGAGVYEGTMTITGPSQRLDSLLGQGAFVRQVNAGEEGWTYDDTVWGLLLYSGFGYAFEPEPTYSVAILPTTCEVNEDGSSYYGLDWNANPLNEMSFINTYTLHVHEYTQKHDETSHWDECGCGDVQNKEAHQYGEWTVTKEATETEKGEKKHTCSVCGYEETEEIAKLVKPGKTGDQSDLALWLTLLAVSAAGGVTGIVVYCKRRKNEQAK